MPTNMKKVIEKGLPDYDSVKANKMLFGAWYAPNPTLEDMQDFKDCGFNMLFLLGEYIGWIGDERVDKALSLCDELGIEAFVDGSNAEEKMRNLVGEYSKHPSFRAITMTSPLSTTIR